MTRRNTTGFGLELNKQMVSRTLRAPALAKMVGISVQMVHKLLRGQKNISPGLLARFAKTLEWSDDDRRRIHQIAARDHGFRI